MNSMAKQMDMFEEGGLMDEGGTVDPVSGNDVPPGSTQEEVRDDIPAQLSEGEFVFPADVVRYFGLEKLMEMRQEAKMGLQRMEDMGQMGNSEEAIMPDNLPFSIEDLDTEDEDEYNTPQEFAYGGVVQMPGTNYTTTPNPGPTTGFRPYVAPTIPGSPQPIQTDPQYQGVQLPGTQFIGATERTNIPTFGQTIGTNPGQYDEFRTYVNSSGQTLQIPFKNGQPLYPIPQGYTLQKEDVVKTESTVPTTTVGQDGDDTSGDGDSGGLSSTVETTTSLGTQTATDKEHEAAFGGNVNAMSHKGYRAAAGELAGYQLGSTGIGSIGNPMQGMVQQMAGAFANTDIGKSLGVPDIGLGALNDKATAMNQARNSALNSLGLANMSQVKTTAQYDTIAAAMNAASKGTSVSQAIAEHPEAIKAGQVAAMTDIGYAAIDIDNPAAVTTAMDYYDKAIEMTQSEINDIEKDYGRVTSTEIDKDTGKLKDISTDKGKVKTAAALQREKELEKQLEKEKAKRDTLSKTTAAQIAAAQKAAEAEIASDPDADIGVGSSGGSSVSGQEDIGGEGFGGFGDDGDGGPTGAPICLTEDMKVNLNGIVDSVTKVQIGDIIDNTIVTEVLHKHMREGYYVVNGELKITNDHPVLANGSWKRTEDLVLGDYINNVEVTSLEYIEQVTPTVYIGTADDRYDVYTEGEVYTVHGQYKNALKKAA
jgi:hypothetical protein